MFGINSRVGVCIILEKVNKFWMNSRVGLRTSFKEVIGCTTLHNLKIGVVHASISIHFKCFRRQSSFIGTAYTTLYLLYNYGNHIFMYAYQILMYAYLQDIHDLNVRILYNQLVRLRYCHGYQDTDEYVYDDDAKGLFINYGERRLQNGKIVGLKLFLQERVKLFASLETFFVPPQYG